MPTQFCRECNNLLYPKIEGEILQYICNRCDTVADPISSVLSSSGFKTRHHSNSLYMKNLPLDPALPRLSRQCVRCSYGICISYMEKTEDKALNSYYICPKCFYEWTD